MIDVLLLAGFVLLPIAAFVITRSLTWTSVVLAFGFGVAGNAVQSLISLGMDWNVRGLQALSLAVMTIVVVVAATMRRGTRSVRRQVLAIVIPAILIGLFLIVMRLMAPGSPGPLTAVGYLINHPQAEDNAKWLHLTAQLADGRLIDFNGYAGGPLLLLMSMMAALISVLSLLLLGGVNEVAVAANTVVGTQFLLIALVPFAFAPFAERRMGLRGESRVRVPLPAIWAGILVIGIASAVITSFGHLSLQFVLVAISLWSAVFLARSPHGARLLMTLVVVALASVWLPFNVLGLALLAVCLVGSLRRRAWWALGAVLLTGAAVWDALISSTLFLLGIELGGTDGGEAPAAEGDAGSVQTTVNEQIETAKSLFTAPGGVEIIQPLVGGLALASVLFVVWLLADNSKPRLAGLMRIAPIIVLGGYVVLIQVGDAIATGGAPHYGGHKLAFAFTITALASTIPIAITGLDRGMRGMTPLRWAAVGVVVVVLTVDTMLPRAISALSPMLWPSIDRAAPAYWSAAEVKPVPRQPLSSLPVACLFAPPESDVPTALPRGQEAYNCTRLLLGMSGLEGRATVLVNWLQTDWLSNEPHWDDFHDRIAADAGELTGRPVVLMNPAGGLAGLSTLGSLLERYPATTR